MIKIGRSALFAGLLVFLAAMPVRMQAEETEAAAADAPAKAAQRESACSIFARPLPGDGPASGSFFHKDFTNFVSTRT